MELVVSTPDCGLVARHQLEFTSRCASVPVMYELGSEFSIEVAIRRDGATLATLDISLDGEEWVTLKTTTSGTETQKLRTRTVETSEYSVTVDVKVRTDDEHVEAHVDATGSSLVSQKFISPDGYNLGTRIAQIRNQNQFLK